MDNNNNNKSSPILSREGLQKQVSTLTGYELKKSACVTPFEPQEVTLIVGDNDISYNFLKVPLRILREKQFSYMDMLVYCQIFKLSHDPHDPSQNGCWATNEEIALPLNCSTETVRKSIIKFKKLGLMEQKKDYSLIKETRRLLVPHDKYFIKKDKKKNKDQKRDPEPDDWDDWDREYEEAKKLKESQDQLAQDEDDGDNRFMKIYYGMLCDSRLSPGLVLLYGFFCLKDTEPNTRKNDGAFSFSTKIPSNKIPFSHGALNEFLKAMNDIGLIQVYTKSRSPTKIKLVFRASEYYELKRREFDSIELEKKELKDSIDYSATFFPGFESPDDPFLIYDYSKDSDDFSSAL